MELGQLLKITQAQDCNLRLPHKKVLEMWILVLGGGGLGMRPCHYLVQSNHFESQAMQKYHQAEL